jgi:hypothetical protein
MRKHKERRIVEITVEEIVDFVAGSLTSIRAQLLGLHLRLCPRLLLADLTAAFPMKLARCLMED